ncbi:MAG: hypothetical protein AAFQ05_08035 [Pseudomonadota bacterium]
MTDALHPRTDRAWEFSQFIAPEGPYYLERMNSEGPSSPVAKTYSASDAASFKKFVEMNNGAEFRRNLYFLPNAKFLTGRRRKENLSQAQFLHVDLDCKDYPGTLDEQQDRIIGLLLERKERPKGVPEPTAVWFTGGGYQALWKLDKPVEVNVAEDLNLRLLHAMHGGPGTHNADRLLRLPWTVNWLNAKKRDAGREPALSYWMDKP